MTCLIFVENFEVLTNFTKDIFCNFKLYTNIFHNYLHDFIYKPRFYLQYILYTFILVLL